MARWSPDGKTIYFTNCVEKDYGTDCEISMARSEPKKLSKVPSDRVKLRYAA